MNILRDKLVWLVEKRYWGYGTLMVLAQLYGLLVWPEMSVGLALLFGLQLVLMFETPYLLGCLLWYTTIQPFFFDKD